MTSEILDRMIYEIRDLRLRLARLETSEYVAVAGNADNITISGFTGPLLQPAADDWLAMLDRSDPTGGVAGTTKKVQVDDLIGAAKLTEAITGGVTTEAGINWDTPGAIRGIGEWVMVDAYTTNADMGKIEADGTVVSSRLATFKYSHAVGALVIPMPDKVLNVRLFGAKGDGVTDDTLALQWALTCGRDGKRVFVPAGTYVISNGLTMYQTTTLVGASVRRGTTILADPGFPADTPMLTMVSWTGDLLFGAVVENILFDCDNVADIGIYSPLMQEQSGLVRVGVWDAMDYGIKIGDPADGRRANNFFLRDLELLAIGCRATTVGIYIYAEVLLGLDKVSIVAQTTNIKAAIQLEGCSMGVISGIHCEEATDHLLIGADVAACKGIVVNGFHANKGVTAIRISNNYDSKNIVLMGVMQVNATNTIVDEVAGITSLSTWVPLYVNGTAIVSGNLYINTIVSNSINVGTATGAAAGQVKTSAGVTVGTMLTTGGLSSPVSATNTLSGDAITVTSADCHIAIDTEGGGATDNLATINGGTSGQILIIHTVNDGRDITIKHGTGNIVCGADFTLDRVRDIATLIYVTAQARWLAIALQSNAT